MGKVHKIRACCYKSSLFHLQNNVTEICTGQFVTAGLYVYAWKQ